MRIFTTISLLAAVTTSGGCSRERDTRWERSRSAYCDEVELQQTHTLRGLDTFSTRVGAIAIGSAGARDRACSELTSELHALDAELRGLTTTSAVLARGRASAQTVEQAGFVQIELSPFGAWDAGSCRKGEFAAATKSLVAMKIETEGYFAKRVERCRSTGWKSALTQVTER